MRGKQKPKHRLRWVLCGESKNRNTACGGFCAGKAKTETPLAVGFVRGKQLVRSEVEKNIDASSAQREVAGLDEFARIRYWTDGRQSPALLQAQGVVLGIGDDAAIVETPPGEVGGNLQWLMAVDTMVETVHFNDMTMEPFDIGWKALAANISDIAAMGGEPRHALVSVSAPPAWEPARIRRLYDGLYACADAYGVAIVGGDTTSAPLHMVVSVTVMGTVTAGAAIRRAGAAPGDAVFVTGPAGMSAAGLHALLAAAAARGSTPPGAAALVQAHQRPAPSVRAARMLAARGTVTSLNDISDGLASEAWEIAEASGVTIALRESLLPRSGSMTSYAHSCGEDPLTWILYGGEDYVLLGTMAAADAQAAKAELAAAGLPFYVIGEVEAGAAGVTLIRDFDSRNEPKREALAKRGYNHFGN
ncbi:thiamine-monophosphate kinase [Paenibacillus taihuensis]|uniref:Thiamine-monophosphate kinase n=1 Tax=Paenibacillus taihuensis TaxID=1156355 RepID=A0A3D9QWV9_9BACL|nr:thiamine-phosphate kinase [Paenibacillus taihuensis]REE68710.1 thiamine-monophosphate kinase [Paenibacillus taihuensis]